MSCSGGGGVCGAGQGGVRDACGRGAHQRLRDAARRPHRHTGGRHLHHGHHVQRQGGARGQRRHERHVSLCFNNLECLIPKQTTTTNLRGLGVCFFNSWIHGFIRGSYF